MHTIVLLFLLSLFTEFQCFVVVNTFKNILKQSKHATSVNIDAEVLELKADSSQFSDNISNEIEPVVKKKVYQPRADASRTITHRTEAPRSDAHRTEAPRSDAPRTAPVWSKATQPSQIRSAPMTDDSKRKSDQPNAVLSEPQLCIKYKLPREMTEFKRSLLAVQTIYKSQNENADTRPSSFGRRSFDQVSAPFPPQSDSSRNRRTKGKQPTESERRENANRKEKKNDAGIDDELYEDDDIFASDVYDDDDDDPFISISELPSAALAQMDDEGMSLDEMQFAIFGEYGIKASISAIKRRLSDERSEKHKRKKSGKTRRERSKARQARGRIDTSNVVVLPNAANIQVLELASLIGVGGGEVVKHLMMNKGLMVSLTQNVDIETAKQTVLAFGKELRSDDKGDVGAVDDDDDDEDNNDISLVSRSPVVTIMGHVDHGKTTLLDRIRKLAHGETLTSNFIPVAPTEAGGITQSISAFKVKTGSDRYVTFIDTPGHAAFSDMRKRGANVTDIVVLVVAADDGIMDQTKECIFAAKAAGCPIVVAVNKIDKDGADAQAIMTDLMNYDVLVEEFGGDVQAAKLSAKQGIGIEGLLEKILLQADVMDLKAKLDVEPSGTVIESRIDKRLGIVATVLVQKGTLKVGDILLAGKGWGRIKKMLSDQGEDLKEAGPSTPVQVIGFSTIPSAGDEFVKAEDESSARNVAEARLRLARQATASSSTAAMKSQAASFTDSGFGSKELIKLPIVIKADVSGSVEALRSSLEKLTESDETAICTVDIVQSGIGEVTASDVAIASVSKARIIAFNVGVKPNVLELAKSSNVDIGFYDVVYDLLNEVEKQVKTTISPPPPGLLIGKAEIKKSFRVGKSGKVAGCLVIEGSIKGGSKVRILRGNRNPVYVGSLSSLRFGKDIMDEVVEGSECGMSFADFQDFEEGDIVECFSIVAEE